MICCGNKRIRKLTMSEKNRPLFWLGIFVLSLLSSAALADSASTSAPAAAVTPDDPKKIFDQAEDKMNREELPEAIALYTQAAELNYLPAQVAMGDFMMTGEFYDTALGWYLMAAMQGNAAGQYGLAQLYHTGSGIGKDEAKALYWYRRSAAQNNADAMRALADAYRRGGFEGQIKVDLDQAKSLDDKIKIIDAHAKKAIEERDKKIIEEAAKKAEAAKGK